MVLMALKRDKQPILVDDGIDVQSLRSEYKYNSIKLF